MSLNGSQPQLQCATSQSMSELLAEVFQGRFENFRAYLKESKIIHLELRFKIPNNANLALLSQALQGTNVTTVDLSRNELDDMRAVSFSKNLPGTNLISVDLSNNNIFAKGAIDFAKNLRNTGVTMMDLSYNRIGDTGAIDFTRNLKDTHVTSIDLTRNNISDKGAIGLAQNLQDTNVTTVNLSLNSISDTGAIRFAQNLKDTRVTVVGLSNNEIGSKGAQGFAHHLKDTNVTTVDLSDNRIGAKGEWALRRTLEIQRYFAPYAVMQLSCNTTDKRKITLNQLCPELHVDPGAYARDIIKKLPNELAAMVAQCLRKNERNPLANTDQYELRLISKNSPFSPLAYFLIQENKQTWTQEDKPLTEQRKLTP